MGVLGKLKKKRFADGGMAIAPPDRLPGGSEEPQGRKYTPLANNADYFSYGQGPEHQFFTGKTPSTPMTGGSSFPQGTAPPPQSGGGNGNLANILLGVPALGKTVGLAGDVLQGFGLDNAFTQGMEKYGNIVGNPIKSAIDWYKGEGAFGPAASGDYTGAIDQVLKDQGITGQADRDIAAGGDAGALESSGLLGNIGKAAGVAGNLYGAYSGIQEGGAKGYANAAKDVAGLAGYDVNGLPIVAGANIAKDLYKGDVGSAGVGAATAAVPLAGLGFALAGLANKYMNNHGDEHRNLQSFLTDNPMGITGLLQSGAIGRQMPPLTAYVDKSGKALSSKYIQDLAGAYYGAKYAPDGDQSGWQTKYDELVANPQMFDQSGFGQGYRYENGHFVRKDGKIMDTYLNDKKVAHGGPIHGHLGQSLVQHFSTGSGQNYVEGPGSGRSDEIPAQLSDGEYVMDAETVALLGDGSSDAGARKLDELRERIRRHKGKKLSKGKFSDNAKDPASYLGSK